MAPSFTSSPQALPRPADSAEALRQWERWDAAGLSCPPAARPLLDAVFGNSPFLSHCLLAEPALPLRLLADGPDAVAAALLAEMRRDGAALLEKTRRDGAAQADTAALMRLLRQGKRRLALTVGLADIAGLWPLERITETLSDLADLALSLAAGHLLRRAHAAGELALPHPDDPERESGLIILGMGKLGARELNYSSDIDIIVFYDPEKLDYRGRRSLPELMIRLTRDLVRILEERTADGYVFRTDLRLRPDPGSTPAAIALPAAETYYESMGQNWERAAMIKARAVAGDLPAGAAFLRFLRPFIWRKHLDFAAIQDIHSIKRQINAHHGGGGIALAGHNVKLGRGGIREVEFFAQTQQLIWGGRDAGLRPPRTCEALAALAAAGQVTPEVAAGMAEAYRFLRWVEHRLQMTEDRQTQTLPEDPQRLAALAVFLGFDGLEAFEAALRRRLRTVEEHYARLFEHARPLAPAGNLVFTGGTDDPATLATLGEMGFRQPAALCGQIRGWHHGRLGATRSIRAREMLTELTPALLAALARTADPDAAFQRFDGFLAALPAGVPLFALFQANPSLLDLVAEVMGDAPALARHLARHPILLDGVVTAGFFDPLPPAACMAGELAALLAGAEDLQESLDLARRWTNDRKFRLGIQTLRNLLEPRQAAAQLSDLAEAVLAALLPRVARDLARLHGRLPGAEAVVIGMGKLGSREMTARSDMDLILVYDVPPEVEASDGAKPLAPSAYFARLTQRLIAALTAKTGEGTLYQVDMRLRPSGNAGPIATSLESFGRYQSEGAWTWEHQALTRARIVAGIGGEGEASEEGTGERLRRAVGAVIGRTLGQPREPGRLLADVADMRERIAREHGTESPWEVKQRRGGLVDIEFIAQALQLRWAHEHPEILAVHTADVLARAARLGLLAEGDAETLEEALSLWSAIQQILRQTVDEGFTDGDAPGRLREVLVRATHSIDFAGLQRTMDATAARVQALYRRLIAEPAAAWKAAQPDEEPAG